MPLTSLSLESPVYWVTFTYLLLIISLRLMMMFIGSVLTSPDILPDHHASTRKIVVPGTPRKPQIAETIGWGILNNFLFKKGSAIPLRPGKRCRDVVCHAVLPLTSFTQSPRVRTCLVLNHLKYELHMRASNRWTIDEVTRDWEFRKMLGKW